MKFLYLEGYKKISSLLFLKFYKLISLILISHLLIIYNICYTEFVIIKEPLQINFSSEKYGIRAFTMVQLNISTENGIGNGSSFSTSTPKNQISLSIGKNFSLKLSFYFLHSNLIRINMLNNFVMKEMKEVKEDEE